MAKRNIKNPRTSNTQVFLIVTGPSCNGNCIMCSVRTSSKNQVDGSTYQIVQDLVKGRRNGYMKMQFTGGEPTIRTDICYLIKQAKKLGYTEIGISTNGVLLSDRTFCDKLIKAGLTNITFSLHTHNRKLNKIISRTPKAFTQTVAGIKNTLTYKRLTVTVVTVVLRSNYQYLFQIGKFIHSLGVSVWAITDMLPNRDTNNYAKLCVKRTELSHALNSLIPLFSDFETIIFYAFSPCLFSREMLNESHANFTTVQEKLDIEKPIRYNQKQPAIGTDNHNLDNLGQKKVKVCQHCMFSKNCSGIWQDYLLLYGDKETQMLAREHNCLINQSI